MQAHLVKPIIAASLDAIVCADEQGCITLWNPAAERMFGYTEQEALGQPLTMLLREQDHAAHLAGVRRFLKTGKPHRLIGKVTETLGLRKDGAAFPNEISLAAEKVDGEWVFTAIMRDITERKQVEEKLRDSEANLASAQHLAHLGSWEWSLQSKKLFWSDELYRLFGVKRGAGDLSYHAFLKAVHADDYRRVAKCICKSLYTGKMHKQEFRIRMPDGGVRFMYAEAKPVLDDSGQPVRMIGVVQDITASRQAEEKLHQRLAEAEENRQSMLYMLEDINETGARVERIKQEWVATFDAVTDPIFLHDRDGNIMRANTTYAGQSGMDMRDIIGKPYWQVFPVLDGPMQSCLRAWETKKVTKEAEEELRMPDGRIFVSHSYSVKDEKGGYAYSVHFMQDITERKQAAERLRQNLEGTIKTIASAVEARDPYTAGHQRRVAKLACAIGQEMGLEVDRIEGIRWGAMIHDIGKIHLPAEILSKPTKLTKLEYNLIKEHSQVGYDILRGIEFPWPVADIVHQHHERLDGSGYPQGRKDGEICLEARIVAVADVVEAMSSHRPYRAGLGIDKALAEIRRGKSRQYDPDVVDSCLALFREGKFSFDRL